MFSEYASRFLAQSQSRISFRQPEESTRNPLQRPRRQDQNGWSRQGNTRYWQRQGGSQFPQFPFASRSQAPLFFSGTDDVREDDDEQEHEREVADFYALQRSRRQFVSNHSLEESSEVETEGSRNSGFQDDEDDERVSEDRRAFMGGIRSSWRGDDPPGKGKRPMKPMEDVDERGRALSDSSSKDQMYDVGLESTHKSKTFDSDEPPGDLTVDMPEDDNPPSVQQFRTVPRYPSNAYSLDESTQDPSRQFLDHAESEMQSSPPSIGSPGTEPPRHDVFWGNLYFISMLSFFSSFVLVWLHTGMPKGKVPLGDTIYSTLHASFYLLAVDTLVATMVAFFWLALLRNYVRPFIYGILAGVPIILFSFTLYPFISSFKHTRNKEGLTQDSMMRLFSSLPGVMGVLWVYGVYKGRHAFGKAVGVLEFACKILAANPSLLALGFGTLAGVVLWTWLWMAMFTRVFLSGHMVGNYFIIDVGAWWLGIFYILIYLWTLGIGSGIQRATSAATVSQWYFHRLAVPAPSSPQVVRAALSHSLTTLFGSICLSMLLSLLARLPVLVLPKRFLAVIGFCSYTLLPNSILILTNPLTLTYSAIHSQSLTASANAVSQLVFMNGPQRRFGQRNGINKSVTSVRPHSLALLILHATRLIAAVAFGFGAWVSTARNLEIAGKGGTFRGSLYAYVVGLIAGAIGWGVLGAMEGVLTSIVDAVVVCWASEMRNGEVRYCREAAQLFGGGDEDDDREENRAFIRG